MKTRLILLATCALFLMPAILSAKDVYHVRSYRWKAGQSWSREKKGNFDIIVDEDAKTITLGGPKQLAGVYPMRDEHPKTMEKDAPRYEGVEYCVTGDCNEVHRVYLREDVTVGGVRWITFTQTSAMWMFEVRK